MRDRAAPVWHPPPVDPNLLLSTTATAAAERRYLEYERRIRDIDIEELVFDNLDYLATSPKKLNLVAMLRESSVERPAEDVAEPLEEVRRRFVAVREELAPRFENGPPDYDLDDLIKGGKVTVTSAERDMYEAVWKQLEKGRTPHRRSLAQKGSSVT